MENNRRKNSTMIKNFVKIKTPVPTEPEFSFYYLPNLFWLSYANPSPTLESLFSSAN